MSRPANHVIGNREAGLESLRTIKSKLENQYPVNELEICKVTLKRWNNKT